MTIGMLDSGSTKMFNTGRTFDFTFLLLLSFPFESNDWWDRQGTKLREETINGGRSMYAFLVSLKMKPRYSQQIEDKISISSSFITDLVSPFLSIYSSYHALSSLLITLH